MAYHIQVPWFWVQRSGLKNPNSLKKATPIIEMVGSLIIFNPL